MGGGSERFDGETLRFPKGSREEALRAVTTVLRAVPDPADQRAILDALFAKGRKQLHHGTKPPAEICRSRTEYLNKVRAWRTGQGYVVTSTQLTKDVEAAYVAATGDVWVPPETPLRKSKVARPTSNRPDRRMVPAGPARERVRALLESGMKYYALVEATGVSHSTIQALLNRGPGYEIQARTEARILAVSIADDGGRAA